MYRELPDRPRITYLMRALHQHYTQFVDAALRNAGFTGIRPGDAKALVFVPAEGIPVGELAARAGVRKQTMLEAVEHLERAGYVERQPNPRDGRSRLVFLTQRGLAARPTARLAGDRAEAYWAQLTSPGEVEALRSGLLRLVRAADAASPQLSAEPGGLPGEEGAGSGRAPLPADHGGDRHGDGQDAAIEHGLDPG
jgi:DNA-binding MarR family transcriptional regulator